MSSIGIIVEFLPGDEYFTIVDLLPNPSFHEAFKAQAAGDLGVSFLSLSSLFLPVGLGSVIGAALTAEDKPSAGFDFSINFGHSFFATEVSAVGVGSKTAIFEFFSGKQPLEGKDLSAWSAVAFNELGGELKCRIKLFYTSRLGVVPKRCESDWKECVIKTK